MEHSSPSGRASRTGRAASSTGRRPSPTSVTAMDRQATRAFQHGPVQAPAWRQAPAPGAIRDHGQDGDWTDRLDKVPRGCLVAALVATGLWFAFWTVVLVFALYFLVGGTVP